MNADDLLRRADEILSRRWCPQSEELSEAIRAYLDAPKDEPVAWARKWYLDGEIPVKEKNEKGRLAWPPRFKFLPVGCHKCCEDDVPLYLHPTKTAPMKPMTDREICDLWYWASEQDQGPETTQQHAFARAIERHHGIGGGDE